MRQRTRFYFILAVGTLLLLLFSVLHIGFGRTALSPYEVVAALRGVPVEPFHSQIVVDMRVPRVLIALVAGAMLGLAGTVLQYVTRNPLAEPGMTGIAAGGVLAIVLVLTETDWFASAAAARWLPIVALAGGLATGGIVYWLQWQRGSRSAPARLILFGVLVTAVLQAVISFLMLMDNESIGMAMMWLIGSLNGRTWAQWHLFWPWAAVTIPLCLLSARAINVLRLGEETAQGLGQRVGQVKLGLFLIAATLTAGAVSAVGALGFIGLIGPHIARRLVGHDARAVLPCSAVCTALLLLVADYVSQVLSISSSFAATQRSGLPVGAVTALIGVPFFVVLMLRGLRPKQRQ